MKVPAGATVCIFSSYFIFWFAVATSFLSGFVLIELFVSGFLCGLLSGMKVICVSQRLILGVVDQLGGPIPSYCRVSDWWSIEAITMCRVFDHGHRE